MEYGNKSKMSKTKYSPNNTDNIKKNSMSRKAKYNNFYDKDEDDVYSPKVYAKKEKKKSSFYDITIPEYEMNKQKKRNKRENDKKYKNKYSK
jgi:hypothetical protein